MARPRVSVVIPAYNEARSLEGIVTSYETFCDEVIVVDDGSTDNTSDIAKKSGAKVIQNIKNFGLPKATPKGLGAASVNVIITMDGDCQHDHSDIQD